MSYHFWGWEQAHVTAITKEYKGIRTPLDLYDALSKIWSADTCAPRMRKNWSPENKTLGQCSITAFLAQDIFGGEVYGIRLPDGNYHCYNVIGDCRFDLTSEQFGDEVLVYEENPKQERMVHFAKEEKRLRYEYLKQQLKAFCSEGEKKGFGREDVFSLAKRKYGTEPEYPWKDRNAVLRHKENKKWYGLIIRVSKEKLGIEGNGEVDVLNVKSDPILIGSLLSQKGFYPAYHMNKEKWISILLETPGMEEMTEGLLDMSYGLTQEKQGKKMGKKEMKNDSKMGKPFVGR